MVSCSLHGKESREKDKSNIFRKIWVSSITKSKIREKLKKLI